MYMLYKGEFFSFFIGKDVDRHQKTEANWVGKKKN